MSISAAVDRLLASRNLDDPQYATWIVDELLGLAADAGASDLHFHPGRDGLRMKWRIDGVLHLVGAIPQQASGSIVVRLKVMAGLLTYQSHLPQEGRVANRDNSLDIRISTFPTLFGEKVVARLLPISGSQLARLGDLGLSPDVVDVMQRAIAQTSGAMLIVGPAGSGKTTTAYACLREILASPHWQRNIASMEDPVEMIVDGVAQSEVAEGPGFDLTSGLRSLVRQDPDVIFVGEIRDPATAEIAFQAALTGQLVITTFHASDAATAISRLADMGVPSYVLRSATNCVVAQQLVRRLCVCAIEAATSDPQSSLGLPVDKWLLPTGCPRCRQTGYLGRQVAAEVLQLRDGPVVAQIEPGVDAKKIQSIAEAHGMKPLVRQVIELVQTGRTSPAEMVRLFGLWTADE